MLFLIACNVHHKKSVKEILEQKAAYYYNHNIYSQAIYYLDSLIALDSTKGEYYFERAHCYDKLYSTKAFPDYSKAIELNYRVADVYYNLGIDATIANKDSVALLFFYKVLKTDSSKYDEVTPLINMCKSHIEFEKTNVFKELQEYKKKYNQTPEPIAK